MIANLIYNNVSVKEIVHFCKEHNLHKTEDKNLVRSLKENLKLRLESEDSSHSDANKVVKEYLSAWKDV